MDKLIIIVILIVVVFILTYDPKSGTLNRYLDNSTSSSCADDIYRGNNPEQCKDSEYDAVQFAKSSTTFMKPIPTNSYKGAIIRQ